MSLHLEREITALQASFTMDSSDEAEAAAAAAVGAFDMKLAEEFGERRARVYSRVVKSQIAGVRQAERLEIARGMVAARNAARDERIQAIRQARIAEDSARAKASREIRRAAKDDLAYRQMYQASARVGEEKLLMEIQDGPLLLPMPSDHIHTHASPAIAPLCTGGRGDAEGGAARAQEAMEGAPSPRGRSTAHPPLR